MQYCDAQEPKDLRKMRLAHFVAGGFYARPSHLAPVRGAEEETWKRAVANLEKATSQDPSLVLPLANLGLAYLVHPSDVPQVERAAEYFRRAADRIAKDKSLDSLGRAAFLVNHSVLDLARGDRKRAGEHLQEATGLMSNVKGAVGRQIADALAYNQGQLLSVADKRKAIASFEAYLASASRSSVWWPLAAEKYESLSREIGASPKSRDAFRNKRNERWRVAPAVVFADGKELALSDEREEAFERLGRKDAVGVPIAHRSAIKRYAQVRPGVDVLAGDQIIAIFLTDGEAPPVALTASGVGATKSEWRVGMSSDEMTKTLGTDLAERTPRSVDSPAIRFRYVPSLGIGYRTASDGKIAEIVIAQISEKVVD
jgi:hypothetical protein